MTELMNRSAVEWQLGVSSTLFLPLLELLLYLEDQITKRMATDLLQKILQESKEQGIPERCGV